MELQRKRKREEEETNTWTGNKRGKDTYKRKKVLSAFHLLKRKGIRKKIKEVSKDK